MALDVESLIRSLDWQVWLALVGTVVAAAILLLSSRRPQEQPTRAPALSLSDFALACELAPARQRPDPFARGTAWEQGEQARSRSSVVAVVLLDAQGTGAPAPAIVIDRSVTGLRLGVDNPVSPGTVLTVKPACAPGGAVGVRIEVRNTAPAGKGWELGCQLLDSCASGTRMMLG